MISYLLSRIENSLEFALQKRPLFRRKTEYLTAYAFSLRFPKPPYCSPVQGGISVSIPHRLFVITVIHEKNVPKLSNVLFSF